MTPKTRFVLTLEEARILRDAPTSGGFQDLQNRLSRLLDTTDATEVALDDATLGAVFRCMTQYGSGGFQWRLKATFQRVFLQAVLNAGKAKKRDRRRPVAQRPAVPAGVAAYRSAHDGS